MGLIAKLFGAMFDGTNIVKQTVEVFRPNAENQAVRGHAHSTAVLAQFAAEFGGCGWFNHVLDGLNRLPRPAFALGAIALFIAAMFDPLWFGERMQGLVLVTRSIVVAAGDDCKFLFWRARVAQIPLWWHGERGGANIGAYANCGRENPSIALVGHSTGGGRCHT